MAKEEISNSISRNSWQRFMNLLNINTGSKALEEKLLDDIEGEDKLEKNQRQPSRGENTLKDIFDSTTNQVSDSQPRIQVISFHEMVEIMGNELFKEGRHDGGLGLTGNYVIALARNQVENLQGRVEEKYQSILARLKVRQKRITEVENRAKEKVEKHDKFLNDGFENPHKYSLLLAFLYLPIALFLIVADIPLALKLTQEGFDLDLAWDEKAEIQRLFMDATEVVKQNWEVFILATGIALCTIFIKALYDEYLSPSPAKFLPHKRAGMTEDEYENKKDQIDQILRIRRQVKLGILGFLLITIFTLGVFRTLHTTSLNDASSATIIVSGTTFILITLIFPIIGGVIFSLGLENLSNSWRSLIYRFKMRKLQRSYDHAIKGSAEVSEDIEVVKTILDRCRRPEFIRQYFNYFISKYRHGYEFGYLSPDDYNSGTDPFSRAEELRHKKISREVFDAIAPRGNRTLARLDNILNDDSSLYSNGGDSKNTTSVST